MKHFLLFYDFAADYLERRGPFKAPHLAHLNSAAAKGDLILGGACVDGEMTGLFLFRVESRESVEAFARSDPYVTGAVATRWCVREWITVAGEGVRK